MSKKIKIIGAISISITVLIIIFVVISASKSMLEGSTSQMSSFGGNDYESDSGMMMEESLDSVVLSPASSKGGVNITRTQTDKKIIKNGSLNLKVDKVDEAVNEIDNIAKMNSGSVFSSNFYQSKANVKSGSLTIKVPVINFEKTFKEIKGVASLVIRESTSGKDVTEEYADLQAQLNNKKIEEGTFLKILDNSGKIADILMVTKEVSRVRGEIERLQGRIKYLSSQTDMSTITASISEDSNITVVASWRPIQVIKGSFNRLIKNIQGLLDFLIRFIIIAIPILIILAIIIFGILLLIYKIGKKIYLKIMK